MVPEGEGEPETAISSRVPLTPRPSPKGRGEKQSRDAHHDFSYPSPCPGRCGRAGLLVRAAAQPPQPLLAYVFPAGGQRGKTIEATVSGTNLQGAVGVHLSGQGVAANVLKVEKPDTLRISVTIAADAALGERDLRVWTPGGISNRYRFMIGDLAELNEVEPNNSPAQPAMPAVAARAGERPDPGRRSGLFPLCGQGRTDAGLALQGRLALAVHRRRRSRLAGRLPDPLRRRRPGAGATWMISTWGPIPC